MKKTVKSFALFLALCTAAGAAAQTGKTVAVAEADTVLLSQTTEGNYLVRKFIVKNQNNSGYSIRYRINAVKLSTRLGENSRALGDLNAFVGNLLTDTLMRVEWVGITGYSSPDGPEKFNQTLARNRALDIKNYVDDKYGFSSKFEVKTHWRADGWNAVRASVEAGAVPDKEQVLRVIDGTQSRAAKEAALKRMPAAWRYIETNILPSMRRVELTIYYGDGMLVEQRTMTAKPAPQPAPQPRAVEPCCVVVDDMVTGLIVEMPEPGHDFDRTMRAERREVRRLEKMAAREAAIAEKLAKEEARAAAKVAQKTERAAAKVVEQAEREARRIAKAEAKAAKKSYKELEKGMN